MTKKIISTFFSVFLLASPSVFSHYSTEEEVMEKIENLPEVEIQGNIARSTKRKKAQLKRLLEEIREQKRQKEREEQKENTICKHCGKKQ